VPNLSFHVEGAEAIPFAASPLLALKLRITNANPEEPVHSIALRCQIQIQSARRRYTAQEQERLTDLFGAPDRWSQTLRDMLWTHASAVVPAFAGSIVTDVQVPCTFDFNVAATKYFHGIDSGHIPLLLLFSGTVFYAAEDGALQVTQIPWNLDAKFQLPVEVWKQMMDLYYPNSVWLTLRRDVFDRLLAYKSRHGIPTWEQTIESMLPEIDRKAAS
jgi:hypothetical protein